MRISHTCTLCLSTFLWINDTVDRQMNILVCIYTYVELQTHKSSKQISSFVFLEESEHKFWIVWHMQCACITGSLHTFFTKNPYTTQTWLAMKTIAMPGITLIAPYQLPFVFYLAFGDLNFKLWNSKRHFAWRLLIFCTGQNYNNDNLCVALTKRFNVTFSYNYDYQKHIISIEKEREKRKIYLMDELLRCVQHVCTAHWTLEIVFVSLFLLINLLRRYMLLLINSIGGIFLLLLFLSWQANWLSCI